MGALTDDMTRLRGEVTTLRTARGALIQDLGRGGRDRKDAVAAIRADFRKAHADMARHARAQRMAFVSRHKRAVAHLRKAFATDLAGAHRAWFDKGA